MNIYNTPITESIKKAINEAIKSSDNFKILELKSSINLLENLKSILLECRNIPFQSEYKIVTLKYGIFNAIKFTNFTPGLNREGLVEFIDLITLKEYEVEIEDILEVYINNYIIEKNGDNFDFVDFLLLAQDKVERCSKLDTPNRYKLTLRGDLIFDGESIPRYRIETIDSDGIIRIRPHFYTNSYDTVKLAFDSFVRDNSTNYDIISIKDSNKSVETYRR